MIPAELSISIAAKLAGRSHAAFRRDVYASVCTPAGRVDRCALEAYRGQPITAEDWLTADHALTGQRRRQAKYRARIAK